MDTQFFDEAPKGTTEGQAEKNRQAQIAADYRICYEAMGVGREDDRGYLAAKYGCPCCTVGQLDALGRELFGQLNTEERANDLYMVERALNDLELAAQPEYP